ncbi:hypothetical protein ACFQ6E_38100 [Streptomyces sp. NPDC056462]|uniref:hypothetical protein n=1 Tax=Streptomyces sp. NPDC056462 TaxID=3345826 RepID=UPI003688664B
MQSRVRTGSAVADGEHPQTTFAVPVHEGPVAGEAVATGLLVAVVVRRPNPGPPS